MAATKIAMGSVSTNMMRQRQQFPSQYTLAAITQEPTSAAMAEQTAMLMNTSASPKTATTGKQKSMRMPSPILFQVGISPTPYLLYLTLTAAC